MYNKKKKILVISTSAMYLGGIETSLLGLLDAIDYDKFEVDLFLFSHRGELFSQINKNVNILPLNKSCDLIREPISLALKSGCIRLTIIRLFNKLFCRIFNKNVSMMDRNFRMVNAFLPKIKKHYDIALGFFGPHDFLVKKVDADIKVGWLHTDYSKVDYDIAYNAKIWESLDYIAGVSNECGKIFAQLLPFVKDKIVTIENILSEEFIKSRADAFDVENEMPNDSIKLLTVGRFSYQKRLDEIPEICRLIIENGINVKWYLIGYGPDERLIRQKITEAGMQDRVIILGKKENPYPYVKNCDVYVQPSRYEGKCVAVREAQMLGKPVIITNYPTAKSQLEDGIDGLVVPMELDECAKSISEVLKDKELLEKLSQNCNSRDYSNKTEIEKIQACKVGGFCGEKENSY